MRYLLALIVIVGGAVVSRGYGEWRLARVSRPRAQTITCAALAARGPGTNAHVRLTELSLCYWAYLAETRRGNQVARVWVPAVPRGGAYDRRVQQVLRSREAETPPPPRQLRVLIRSDHCASQAALGRLAEQSVVTGLVVNAVESLGDSERAQLQKSYPGTDLSRVYILAHKRRPAGPLRIYGLLGCGLLMLCVGILGLGWRLRRGCAPVPDRGLLDADASGPQ